MLIERGTYPPFYECIGCVIERAVACVDDMRFNKSGNVHHNCKMQSTFEKYNADCCPVIGPTPFYSQDLQYIGAAYPMAISCVESVGCGGSTIYKQLVKECRASCTDPDPRSGNSRCFSAFNSAFTVPSGLQFAAVAIIVCSLLINMWSA